MSNDHSAPECPGCFRTLEEKKEAWINVKLKHPAVVVTVILINREDSRKENLTGSEIRVGFDALPKNNQFCAYADTSGTYHCLQAIQGNYLGIYNPDMNN